MPEHPDVTIVRSTYEAANRDDITGFLAILAHDIVWHEQTCRTLPGRPPRV
jgi:ketosteroid isomerase-like protein